MNQTLTDRFENDLKFALLKMLLGEKLITTKEFESIWEMQKKV